MATITSFIRSSSKDRDKATFVRFRLVDGRKKQLFYKSSLSIAPKYWSNETQSIKARVSYNEIERAAFNASVANIKQKIENWYVGLKNKEDATSEALTAYMDGEEQTPSSEADFHALFAEFLSARKLSENRRKQMRVTDRDISRYELYRSTKNATPYFFDVKTADSASIRSFEEFLRDEHKICKQYPDLYIKVKAPSERGQNTIIFKLTCLRAFFHWLNVEGLTENNPFHKYKIGDEVYGTPIYLTREEIKTLAKFELSTKALATQRDIFIFQSCVGCRYSDLVRLTRRSVVDGFVEYIARKTREDRPITVRVPLNATALAILERYASDDQEAPLLPFIESQPYNRVIKTICKEAGLDRWVQVLNTVTREPEQKRLYDVVSSHTARKNFIGNIFSVVREQSLVSALTGHKAGSKAFARYRDIDDKMKRAMVAHLDEVED